MMNEADHDATRIQRDKAFDFYFTVIEEAQMGQILGAAFSELTNAVKGLKDKTKGVRG